MYYRIYLTLFLVCLLICFTTNAQQEKFMQKQISFQHENDAFALKGTDGYYTSGIFLNYLWLKKKQKPGNQKTIFDIGVGQKIYTPGIREVFVVTEIDRPITGYLYGSFAATTYKNKSFLKLGVAVGTIGPAAQGKRVLDLVHPVLKIDADFWDWMFDYGLKNEIGINTTADYGFSLLEGHLPSIVQLTPVSTLNLGTTFTNVSQSVTLQVGKQNKLYESGYWNSRLRNNESSAPKHRQEIFAYYKPAIMYQLYNATVQGGLFRSDKGRISDKTAPIVFSNEIGAMFSDDRLSISAHYNFTTREARLQENNQTYGGLKFSYRFQ